MIFLAPEAIVSSTALDSVLRKKRDPNVSINSLSLLASSKVSSSSLLLFLLSHVHLDIALMIALPIPCAE
jgi:hypothetical protein